MTHILILFLCFIGSLLGDAPIRGATISMFFDLERDVERMCGMEYYHQGLVPADCKCTL